MLITNVFVLFLSNKLAGVSEVNFSSASLRSKLQNNFNEINVTLRRQKQEEKNKQDLI